MTTQGHGQRSSGTIGRRIFLKVGGAVGGVVAATGLEGIFAAGRAPAFAQPTKLHLLQWVDFIPEGDVELRRQAAEYSRQTKTDVTVETINANDLQARITAAIQSGTGPDIIQLLHNWPHLYQSALVDLSDLCEWKARDQGGFLPPNGSGGPRGHAVARLAVRDGVRTDHLPQIMVRRGGREPAPEDPRRISEARRRAEEERQAVGADPRAHLRRRPRLDLSHGVGVRRGGDRHDRQESRLKLEGDDRVGEVDGRLLEGRVRRERAGLG